jgi:hypothetical protein
VKSLRKQLHRNPRKGKAIICLGGFEFWLTSVIRFLLFYHALVNKQRVTQGSLNVVVE